MLLSGILVVTVFLIGNIFGDNDTVHIPLFYSTATVDANTLGNGINPFDLWTGIWIRESRETPLSANMWRYVPFLIGCINTKSQTLVPAYRGDTLVLLFNINIWQYIYIYIEFLLLFIT